MTSLQCGGSVLICFFVTVENDLVSASGSKLTGLLCRGIAIDLMLDWTSKLTWGSVMGSKLTWFLCAGSKLTWFYRQIRSWLVSCAGVKIDFRFVCGPKIKQFSFLGQNWLVFYRGDRNWLGFCVGAENELLLVCGTIELVLYGWSKLTWFWMLAANHLFWV